MSRLTNIGFVAKSNSSGTITFTVPARGTRVEWVFTCGVPLAPPVAQWIAYRTTTPYGSWIGSSAGGKFTMRTDQRFQVKGKTLAHTTTYRLGVSGTSLTVTPDSPGVSVTPVSSSTINVTYATFPINVNVINTPTVKVTELPPPPSTVSSILTVRRALAGTGTPTADKKKLCTTTLFTTLKIGIRITGTPANTGSLIYIGGSNVTTNSFAIPAKTGSHEFSWRKAKTIYLLGTTGDIANVWAE